MKRGEEIECLLLNSINWSTA